MLISGATSRAISDVAAREADVLRAFVPGAVPERTDVATGSRSLPSLDPLSVAAPSDAFFVVRDDRGRLCFSRDGTFQLRGGELVDSKGAPVLGYLAEGATLSPLRADPVDAALNLTDDARVESDGSVTYGRATIDPRTGTREERRTSLGRIALARFAAGTKLDALDASRSTAPPGAIPHVGRAADGNFAALTTHAREGSRVDIDRGLQKLQEAYLALDALRSADRARDGVRKTAMDLLK
ncbi:MAG TPA: hypothetical protein VIG51_13155 [Candidatus Baltobacteraceae bacterium]|jgi:flagellar basal body rod protein FlgG